MAGQNCRILGSKNDLGYIDLGTGGRQKSSSQTLFGKKCGLEIHVSVFSSYDTSESARHGLVIESLFDEQRYNFTNVKRLQNTYQVRKAGKYRVVVTAPYAMSVVLGQSAPKGPSQVVEVNPLQTNGVGFKITRKQSIIYDIPVKFKVAANRTADGSAPWYEASGMSEVTKHAKIIEAEAQRQGVDPDLVKAIMYMETTHGYYDAIPAAVDANKTLLPMNIHTEYWKDLGFSRKQLKDSKTNIKVGVLLLKKFAERVEPKSIETIATVYQNLGATKVSNYGARVAKIYNQKLWIPEPSALEKIQKSLDDYNRLDPVRQLDVLRQLFGG